jgi:hypothetical protein
MPLSSSGVSTTASTMFATDGQPHLVESRAGSSSLLTMRFQLGPRQRREIHVLENRVQAFAGLRAARKREDVAAAGALGCGSRSDAS